ncbi:energy transducer TonB [Spirosoma sp. KUDC1026]|uniref:energy transducer TonB n=1 Tax=Spirosoma sp. KUDC1026 TaxID=2745947 RepID=UPI00159BB6C8|nr:energy transducer TonB [Spirosoma sp. KUDC1026]QKZ13535.1 energy transducer TonB [Spirosoma sp. KUDC1026]
MKFLLALAFIGATVTALSATQARGQSGRPMPSDTTVYMIVQEPPAFVGGKEALFQFIQANSKYPVNSKKGPLVQLRLLIEKDGSVSEVKTIYTDVSEELTQEANRIGRTMPRWIPGSQDGRLLRAYAVVPIRFTNGK